MKLLITLNPEGADKNEIEKFERREAARAILIDNEGKVALLYVGKENYYKLPGGELDTNEDAGTALKRECLEETGCDIEILNELGYVVEYIKALEINQNSYGYLSKVVGQKGIPSFTPNELSKEFSLIWLPYDEAVSTLESTLSRFEQSMSYIIPREIAIIRAAKEYLP